MAENFWSVNISTLIGWVVIIAGGITFILRYVGTLQARVLILETRMNLFWSAIEKHMATILHHPITPERDLLIDGYLADSLTPEQLQEFMHLLDGLIHDDRQPSGERAVASMLLLAVRDKYDAALRANAQRRSIWQRLASCFTPSPKH